MEIEVELRKEEKVIVECQTCNGDGEYKIDTEYKKCPNCDGTGKVEQKLAEDMVVYKEIDEKEIVNSMEPAHHTRSI